MHSSSLHSVCITGILKLAALTLQGPLCSISFNLAPSGPLMLPTCHAHASARDGFDLLVGLSTGDGKRLSSGLLLCVRADDECPFTGWFPLLMLHLYLMLCVIFPAPSHLQLVGLQWWWHPCKHSCRRSQTTSLSASSTSMETAASMQQEWWESSGCPTRMATCLLLRTVVDPSTPTAR